MMSPLAFISVVASFCFSEEWQLFGAVIDEQPPTAVGAEAQIRIVVNGALSDAEPQKDWKKTQTFHAVVKNRRRIHKWLLRLDGVIWSRSESLICCNNGAAAEYVHQSVWTALHPWLDAGILAKVNKKINTLSCEKKYIYIVKKKKNHWKFVVVCEQLLFSVLVSHLALAFKFLEGWRTFRYFKLHFSDAWSMICFRKPGLQCLSFSFKAYQTCSKHPASCLAKLFCTFPFHP